MPDKSVMSQETFSKILPYIGSLHNVSFCGIAEALFNKKVTSFMQQIREKSQGVYVSIFTNAELLIEKYCREFIIYRLDSLVFSIDGVNADFVDTFRKNGSFETVISNRQPKSSALKYIPAKFCSF